MLVQTAGNQFLVVKKSFYMTLALAVGVIVNIIMNFFMIRAYGIVGCSLSTLVGYAVSVLMVVIVTSKMKLLKLSKKFVILSVLMTTVVLSLFFKLYWALCILVILALGLILIGYGKDVLRLLKSFKKKR